MSWKELELIDIIVNRWEPQIVYMHTYTNKMLLGCSLLWLKYIAWRSLEVETSQLAVA